MTDNNEEIVIAVRQEGADQAASGIVRVADSADRAAASTDRLAASQAGVSGSLRSTGAAATESGSNLAFLQQQMAALSGLGGGVALALKSVAAAVTGSLVAALSDYQDGLRQTEGTLQVLMHSVNDARQAMADLRDLSGQSGASIGKLAYAYQNIYNSGAADGTEDAKSLLKSLQDLNTVYLTGPENGTEVIRDLSKAMKDGAGWAEVYEKSLNQAPGVAVALENAFGKSGDALENFFKSAETDTTRFQAQLDSLSKIGVSATDVPDAVKKRMDSLREKISGSNVDLAKTFGDWLTGMSANIAKAADNTALTGEQMAARLKQSFINAESVLSNSIFGNGGDPNALGQQAFRGVIANIGTVTRLANVGALALSAYFAPFVGGGAAAGIVAAAAALLQFGDRTDMASKAALTLGTALAGWNAFGPLGGAIGGLTALLVTNHAAVDGWIASFSGGRVSGLGELFDIAKVKAGNFFAYLSGQAPAAGASLESSLTGALDTVGSIFDKIKQAALDAWTFVTDTWNRLPSFVQGMIQSIGVSLAGAKIGEMLGLSPTQGAALGQLFDQTMRLSGGYEKLGEVVKSARESLSNMLETAAPAAKQASASVESEASKLASAKAARDKAIADRLADYYDRTETIHLGKPASPSAADEDDDDNPAAKAAASVKKHSAALQDASAHAREFMASADGVARAAADSARPAAQVVELSSSYAQLASSAKTAKDALASLETGDVKPFAQPIAAVPVQRPLVEDAAQYARRTGGYDLTASFGQAKQAAESLGKPLDEANAKSEQVASWWDKIKIQMFAMLATGSFDPFKLILASNAAEGLAHINELTQDISHGLNDMQRQEAVSVAAFAGYNQGGIAGAALGYFGAKLATAKESLGEMAQDGVSSLLRIGGELATLGPAGAAAAESVRPIGVAAAESADKFLGLGEAVNRTLQASSEASGQMAEDWSVGGAIGRALAGLLGLFDDVGNRAGQAAKRASQGVAQPNAVGANGSFVDRAADSVNQAYESAKLFGSALFENPTGGASLATPSAPFKGFTGGAELYPPGSNDNASLWERANLRLSYLPQEAPSPIGQTGLQGAAPTFASQSFASMISALDLIAKNTGDTRQLTSEQKEVLRKFEAQGFRPAGPDYQGPIQQIDGMRLIPPQDTSGSSDLADKLGNLATEGSLKKLVAQSQALGDDASASNNILSNIKSGIGDIQSTTANNIASIGSGGGGAAGGQLQTNTGYTSSGTESWSMVEQSNQRRTAIFNRLYGAGNYSTTKDMYGQTLPAAPLPGGQLYGANQYYQAWQGGLDTNIYAASVMSGLYGVDIAAAPQYSSLLKSLLATPNAAAQLANDNASPQLIQFVQQFGAQVQGLQSYLDGAPDGPWKQPIQQLITALESNSGMLATVADSMGHISAFGYAGQYNGAVPTDANNWFGTPNSIYGTASAPVVAAQQAQASASTGGAVQSASSPIVINFNVAATDVNSFNSSQQQIMSQLAYGLQYAAGRM